MKGVEYGCYIFVAILFTKQFPILPCSVVVTCHLHPPDGVQIQLKPTQCFLIFLNLYPNTYSVIVPT